MDFKSIIYVAGHNGMVGSAICRKLKNEGFTNIITKSSKELDLRSQNDVNIFFNKYKPEYVFLAAAKVGGIHANNSYKGEFIYDNLILQCNVIHAAFKYNVNKLLFLGSSCIYPKMADQPIVEDVLLTGELEKTNEPYAVAKIAGLKLCEFYREQYGVNFISAMPTNLYGPNDNYDLLNSHVLPALIRKFHEAKMEGSSQVEIWGSGNPRREFLHVEDLATACILLMRIYNGNEALNVGTGKDITIKELALMIKNVSGYKGEIVFNTEKLDGTPRKWLDISKISKLGWSPKISLKDRLEKTYTDFVQNKAKYLPS
ncbi:MAG: GDP-fucose synthetase [Crocinitomicaceae bacterium]|nr:GDP-fucose synthetase [Crocinitomicaceae bacterium]